LKNPRRKDGKDISYLEQNVTQVIWPLHKITFIEIIPGAEEEQIISFVRE
jgi:predicted transcriptional regulator